MIRNSISIVLLSGICLSIGCGQVFYPAALGLSLEDVQEIINNDSLDAQEKRERLADNGIDEVVINGLLKDERLANQFGGDLESAYDKVVGDQMTEMTPDEVQYYGDATDQTTYDDTEAQAIVDFFIDNEIDSLTELEDYLDDDTQEIPSAIDETNLRSVFIDTSTDDVQDKL